MTINNKQTDINELADLLIAGVRTANRKMAEKAAANNEELIIGDKNGGFKSVPAKELLKTMPK